MQATNDDARLIWRRSTKCNSGLCVEVALAEQAALVRDGKHPQGAHLTFGAQSWGAFLSAVKAGEYDG